MPSTNKTQYLGLNQWEESDRPMRNDFNSDNSLVDSALGAHINDGDIHITAEDKKYLADMHATYMYSGSGEATKTVILTESFRFIAVFANGMPLATGSKVYSAFGYSGVGSSAGLSISSSGAGFTVTQGSDESGNSLCLNESGVQYKVIMFK